MPALLLPANDQAPRVDFGRMQALELMHHCAGLQFTLAGADLPGVRLAPIPLTSGDPEALASEVIRLARLGAWVERTARERPLTPVGQVLSTLPAPWRP